MHKEFWLSPLRIVFLYGVVATSWILFSDVFLHQLGLPSQKAFLIGAVKGSMFVGITMLLLYFLLRGMLTQSIRIQHKHEFELRQSEERFSKAFRSNPEGMTITTIEDGRYIEVNDAFLAIIGYGRNELLGSRSSDLDVWVNPADRSRLLTKLNEGTPVQAFSTRFKQKSGDLVEVELSVERIQLQKQSCLLGIARDLTQHRRLERQFLQAQKMEALGQLAAGIAHDFRNQLMLISANAEMLEITDEKNCKRRDQILSAVQKSESLTRQLLAYSRRQETQSEVLDLSLTLSEICRTIPALLGRNIRSEIILNSNWNIYADRAQLEQVLMNLTVNARDAMPDGGHFRITTSNFPLPSDSRSSDIVTIPKGEYVQLVVSDTGHGMDDAICARIFEPFFTTKEQGKGTGLGLAAVYGIVKQARGYIFVESHIGIGTTFRILLPRYMNIESERAASRGR